MLFNGMNYFMAIAAHVGFDLIEFLPEQYGRIWFSSWNLSQRCRVPSVFWFDGTTWPSKRATHRTFIQTQKHCHHTLIQLNEWVEFMEKRINTRYSISINISSWIECCRAHVHYMIRPNTNDTYPTAITNTIPYAIDGIHSLHFALLWFMIT